MDSTNIGQRKEERGGKDRVHSVCQSPCSKLYGLKKRCKGILLSSRSFHWVTAEASGSPSGSKTKEVIHDGQRTTVKFQRRQPASLDDRFCCFISLSNSFAAPWTIAHQGPLSMGFPRQEYESGLPCPTQGSNPPLLSLMYWWAGSLPLHHQGNWMLH